MSWYEEAAKAMGGDCIDIHYDYDLVIGSVDINVEKVAAIIAAHDPNRWIPVTEQLPQGKQFDESGNPTLFVEAFPNEDGQAFVAPFVSGKFLYFSELYGDDWWPLDKQPAHWREIVLPEVKG